MFIRLTRVSKELTPEAMKRLEEYSKEYFNKLQEKIEEPDDNGPSLEWYREQGLKAPEGMDENNSTPAGLFMKEEDLTEIKSDYLCNYNFVQDFEETKRGTVVTYDTTEKVTVLEDIKTIIKLIKNG